MKSYFAFILFVFSLYGFSQYKPISFNSIPSTLFGNQSNDTINVISIEMLGKMAQKDILDISNINIFPKEFSWHNDIRWIESNKIMALNIRQQDFCGRDFLIDSYSEALQNLYLNSISYP
ncbi:hypothetical protein [Flavobacterium sp.]|jgi:hypothetical protein|uniref:hypothetical protein n=1 Tax=Flavobacterium sp. TaxID=239 RepID=UPI00334020B0